MFGPALVRSPPSWEFFAQQEGSLNFCALLGFSILPFFASFASTASFSGLVCSALQSFGVFGQVLVQ